MCFFIKVFQEKFQRDAFQAIEVGEKEDGGLNVDIDTDFVEFFTETYPDADLDETFQGFFEVLISGFIDEMENNPDKVEEFKTFVAEKELEESS